MNKMPINRDPFYPDTYHQDDHTPECECHNDENNCQIHGEYCDGCNRLAKYCGCP